MTRLFRRQPDPRRMDMTLAALLTLGAELAIWVGGDASDHRLGAALVAPVLTAPIAVRRRYPTLVGAGVPVVSAFAHTFWSAQFVGYPIANFCAMYALAVWTPPRRFALGLALFLAATLAFIGSSGSGGTTTGVLYVSVSVVATVLVRRIVLDREQRLELAERERSLAAREAVLEERARIARELHDAVAHDVSIMVVQASAERRALDGPTAASLESIEELGRAALVEMRRLLGMLRGEDAEAVEVSSGG
jgi:signal transduction histidine kinase